MLNEPALIMLSTLVASGMLVLGVLDLLWPASKKPPRRAAAASPPPDVAPAAAPEPILEETYTPEPMAVEIVEPIAAEPVVEIVEPEPEIDVTEPEPDVVESPASLLARCRALAAERRYDDVIAEAMPVLQQDRLEPGPAISELWLEVASARDRTGDRENALAAFGAAAHTAAADARERIRYEGASWAAGVARDMVASSGDVADRYNTLLAARAFVASAREVLGAEASLDTAQAAVDVDYWPAYVTHVTKLVADRDHAEAYRLATEALSDDTLPPERRRVFEDVRSETLMARIEALTDRALLAVDEHREWEAVGALERAETLLRSASSISAERRDDAATQVAAGYSRLGRRRVDNAEYEDAVDPLLRALRISKADNEARDDARSAMVKALTGVVDLRIATIQDVAGIGNRESAAAQADKLWTLLRTSMAAGVPQEPLTGAIAATRRLIEEFGGSV